MPRWRRLGHSSIRCRGWQPVAPESMTAEFADYHSDLTEWLPEGERQARVVFRGAANHAHDGFCVVGDQDA